MVFERMPLEDWFDKYQYEVDWDIGESGMKFLSLNDLGFELGDVDLRYGYHLGAPELREIISKQYRGRTAENVAVTTGASEANFSIIAHLVGKDDHIVVEHPTYPSLYQVPRSLERDMSLLHLTWEDDFKPNMDELEKLIKPNTKLVTLTHPNNPTGSQIDENSLMRAIQLAEENDFHLMVDETYRDLTFKDPPPLAATLSKNAISITSMSKVYGLPGIRIGWAVADRPIIEGIRAVREQMTICNSQLGEAVALRVLQERDEILRKMRNIMLENYEILKKWMDNQQWLEWKEPEGGVVAAPRLKQGGPTRELCKLLVDKYRTFVVPGYGLEMDEYFRLGYGGEKEELIKGLENLGKALEELYS
ncbi:aminotransferase class I/II-fold pyridoxal phosphate-dependent enzyme [Candidatus Thorarchaeota archaeon]|nr:MAG: aminotransferase class I/II-fold pyridoxal phosphate-dependent enzyme [Candidatus Thorarchaeota archaeon]